jgi:hypothetical protein
MFAAGSWGQCGVSMERPWGKLPATVYLLLRIVRDHLIVVPALVCRY